MTMTLPAVDALARVLPPGYRARPFREEDREPLTAERNAELPEVEHESASEWREWERTLGDATEVRVIVETDAGEIAGMLSVSNGGPFRAPDGSARGSVNVSRAHRRRGIGGALLPILEDEARRRGAPKLFAGVSAREPASLAWAEGHGYRDVGRRIQAAIDLDQFDPEQWAERSSKPRREGLRFDTLGELRTRMDDERFERLLHEIYDVEAEAWVDVPIATTFPHWPYDVCRRLMLENASSALDLGVIAREGKKVVGITSSY